MIHTLAFDDGTIMFDDGGQCCPSGRGLETNKV
ncbi:hypothetical protein PF005_g23601 [Phytophthora fragariae]|uniref:Uncharacterized protein n=2 Tax=Phytophthora TaxID=4783 RepID=A0A6A3X350_9STRA|nr:hypothetical protein PF003_g5958 [Phytophthora fragariae]KAE9005400.1 hypothetical protein PR002_g16771 [Phytophthora rubi]KAE8925446.1 hypothetical protein PF009_g24347 [Phytophthora fragariae]KAE8980481.1 hypothetical protein PF011_g22422 [Phytophthora fragariae]KAE9078930.1 hypothetical protein PF010_g22949 [Phytophthora fragariae]